MALSKPLISFFLELYEKNFFKNLETVLDMGDIDLDEDLNFLKSVFLKKKIKINEEDFKRSISYPDRPRTSSSTFWKQLGFSKTHRLDIEKLPRMNKKDEDDCFIVDLNYPISKKLSLDQYDLVTDFGNNEHPFNIAETYKSMHSLTKKNGYIFITQNYINGNGFYNFDFPFFESMAMANNYKIVSNFYIIYNNVYEDLIVPINSDILNLIKYETVKDGICINYLFQKTNDDDFKYPYQALGTSPIRETIYQPEYFYNTTPPSRGYIPTDINSLSGRFIIKILLKKIFDKFKI